MIEQLGSQLVLEVEKNEARAPPLGRKTPVGLAAVSATVLCWVGGGCLGLRGLHNVWCRKQCGAILRLISRAST